MLKSATQEHRQLSVETSLGKDFFLLKSVTGSAAISELFEYDLELLCGDASVDAADLIGKPIRFAVHPDDHQPIPFHGVVRRFVYKGQTEREVVYQATVVPWLWLLTQTVDCRIFQKKSTPQILELLFGELGLNDFETAELHDDYPKRNYCVQYRESDFAFVSRLMEEEGIYYFFRQQEDKHVLVLADSITAYQELAEPEVVFPVEDRLQEVTERVTSWEHRYRFQPGRVAIDDYNFKRPTREMISEEESLVSLEGNSKLELFDYPGRYQEPAVGRKRARVRIEQVESEFDRAGGTSNCLAFAPGGKFQFKTHRVSAEIGREYVLTRVEISADVGSAYISGDEQVDQVMTNRFQCMPADVLFRPPCVTPKAVVEGPQTAMVVGPQGEEIYTDKHGRVKTQFHWDRNGRHDEHSSCWIRVSQVHAGSGWGGIDLPRIGEEVIVDFLEGDPDMPIITGRVYNGDNRPPFSLPGEMTRSGMKTNTHKGAGYNEMSMDDTQGKEQIRTNAQFDMDTMVGNNQSLVVGVDRSEEIGSNDSLKVGANRTEDIGADKTVKVGSNMTVQVGSKTVVNAGSSITLKCGASKLHMNAGGVITLTGTIITVAAAANAAVAAPMTQVVGGAMLTTVGGINMMTGGICHVGAAGLASVSGGKVDIAAAGNTAIKGSTITLN